MKIILTTILLLISSVSVADTLKQFDLIGSWKFHKPDYDIRYKIASWITGASSHKMRLTFKGNEEVLFVREFDNGEVESIQSNRFEVNDDLYIIWLPLEHGGLYKLTLSGWDLGHSKLLFGYFYLYDANGLFNGWPVSFEPIK